MTEREPNVIPTENVFDKQTLVLFGFTPQGLQHEQMFEGFREYAPTSELLDEFQNTNKIRDVFSLPKRRLLGGELTASANATAYTAAYLACKEAGLLPDVVFGISWGESGSLVASGSINPLDMPHLGKNRGHQTAKVVKSLMRNQRHTTGMALIRAVKGKAQTAEMHHYLNTLTDKVTAEVARRKEEFVKVSNIYHRGASVVSGFRYLIDDLEDKLPESLFLTKIDVDGAYHTEVMLPAVSPFADDISKYEVNDPDGPIIMSPTTRGFINSREEAIDMLLSQLTKQVDLPGMTEECLIPRVLGSAAARQVLFFEVGPTRFKPGARTNKGTTIDLFLPTLGSDAPELNVREVKVNGREVTVIAGRISSQADFETQHIQDMLAEIKQTELTK